MHVAKLTASETLSTLVLHLIIEEFKTYGYQAMQDGFSLVPGNTIRRAIRTLWNEDMLLQQDPAAHQPLLESITRLGQLAVMLQSRIYQAI